MKRGNKAQKDTICWDCQNFMRCSWAHGKPVEGWTATPTIVRDREGDFKSFIVEECPLFKEDAKKGVTIFEIAQILGKTRGTIISALRTRGGTIFLRGWLKEKGYKLKIFTYTRKDGLKYREFIIYKIPPKK